MKKLLLQQNIFKGILGLSICVGALASLAHPLTTHAATFTISGTLYTSDKYEPQSQITWGETIKLAIGTSTVSVQSTTTDSGAGTFSFTVDNSNGLSVDTPFVLWTVVGAGDVKAATVSKFSSTTENLTGVDLYDETVIVRQEGSTSTTLTDLAVYDSTNDSDIKYTASSTLDELTVLVGQELHIWSGDTFVNAASSTFTGDFHNDGGVFDNNNGTTTFDNYSTPGILSGTLIGTSILGKIVIAGSYTASNNASTTDLTIESGGSFTAPSLLSIAGDYTNNGTFNDNSGTVYLSGAASVFDVSEAVYVDGFSVSGQDTYPAGLAFSSNGRKMFMSGVTGQDINEYTLSTAFDVSTASFVDSFSVSSQDTTPTALDFSSDGLKMFVVGTNGKDINEYTLSTAFDVSTASFVDSFSVSGQDTTPYGLAFSSNGLKMFMVGTSNDAVYEYTLSTAFDVSTASYVDSFSVESPNNINPTGIAFSSNGSKMFVLGDFNNNVNEYTLSTAFDISTASFVDSFSITSQDTDPYGIAFSNDGSKMFVLGYSSDNIHEYRLAEPQVFSGGMTSGSNFSNLVVKDAGLATLSDSASTTNLTISSEGSLTVPGQLSIDGNYTNEGYFNASTSEVFLTGSSQQTATGTMTDASAFYDLTVNNTSANGTTSQSVIFGMPIETTNTFTVVASSSAQFLAGATSTFENVDWDGTESSPIWLRSSSAGSQWYLDIPGSQLNVDYVNVKDSRAGTEITSYTSIDSGNNTNWTFDAPSASSTLASAANQSFQVNQGATAISSITITDSGVSPTITAANDLRIAIASSSVAMEWDTTDTTASISGGASGKVSSTVSYEGDGSVLVIDVTSNFAASDSITISGLSFTNFTASNTATSALSLFVDGSGDTVADATDGKTVTITAIEGAWNSNSWSLYDTITIDSANIDSDLTDFPVYVDLADLTSQFWDTVSDGGGDIRVTTNEGTPTELPREVVSASTTLQTGELHFKADTISSTVDTVFRIWYNGTSNDYASTSVYGANTVWSDYDAVLHLDDDPSVSNNIQDSTSNGNTGNTEGSMTAGDVVDGKIGQAISFDEVNDRIAISDDDSLSLPSTNWNLSFWVNFADNIGSNFQYIASWGGFQASPSLNIYIPEDSATAADQPTLAINTAAVHNFTGTAGNDLNWQHWQLQNESGTVKLYINGTADSNTFSYSTGVNRSDSFYLGGRSDGNVDRYFGGDLDSFRLRDEALSGAWLSAEYINQSTTTDFYTVAEGTVPVTGSSTITDHDDTQVSNAFDFQNKTNETLFAFKLIPESGNATITNMVFTLSGAKEIDTSDFSNLRLYRDHDNDAAYDATDTQVGGTGVMSLTSGNGDITFTGDFLSTTTENYILVGDWNAPPNGAFLNIDLYTSGVTAIDDNGSEDIYGSVNGIQHSRNNRGGGGGATAVIGEAPPEGREVVTGGTNEGGELIGDDPDYRWPTAGQNIDWGSISNAYDKVDGTYATAATAPAMTTVSEHGFSVPSANEITGIAVKMEISGSMAADDIEVQLWCESCASWTAAKTTPTLTTTDTVVTLGGASDLWGESWVASDFSDANFTVRLTTNPSLNVVQVDAIQVRVYHQASGGGSGGGGAI